MQRTTAACIDFERDPEYLHGVTVLFTMSVWQGRGPVFILTAPMLCHRAQHQLRCGKFIMVGLILRHGTATTTPAGGKQFLHRKCAGTMASQTCAPEVAIESGRPSHNIHLRKRDSRPCMSASKSPIHVHFLAFLV